jgi:phosphatidylserine decarboxylase
MALFFRDPDRRCDAEAPAPDDVLSPADGVVMVAGEPQEGVAPEPAPEGDWQQVSVFLSVVDVHVNRSPYHGEVVESSYRRGSFLAAYRKESAHRNERSELWLRDGDRTVVFRQIVGVLARRIVTRTGVGRRLATGERMGLMKFGSRMDVFVPRDCTVLVRVGQRVRGGETVIARWSGAR